MFGRKLGRVVGTALGDITGRRIERATTGNVVPALWSAPAVPARRRDQQPPPRLGIYPRGIHG